MSAHAPSQVELSGKALLKVTISTLLLALTALLLFVLLSALIGSVSFTQALALKTVWGALLGGVVSYIALQFALRDYAA